MRKASGRRLLRSCRIEPDRTKRRERGVSRRERRVRDLRDRRRRPAGTRGLRASCKAKGARALEETVKRKEFSHG